MGDVMAWTGVLVVIGLSMVAAFLTAPAAEQPLIALWGRVSAGLAGWGLAVADSEVAQTAWLRQRVAELTGDNRRLNDELAVVTAERDRLTQQQQTDKAHWPNYRESYLDAREQITQLEAEMAKLRADGPDVATREELLRARDTIAAQEERLAIAERRPHGRPYDRRRT